MTLSIESPSKVRKAIFLMNSMASEGVTPSGAPAISHSGYFLLIDGNAHIRGAYDSGDIQRLDAMIRDARYLVRTAR